MRITKENGIYIAQYKGNETKGTSFMNAIEKMFFLLELKELSK